MKTFKNSFQLQSILDKESKHLNETNMFLIPKKKLKICNFLSKALGIINVQMLISEQKPFSNQVLPLRNVNGFVSTVN